MAVRLITGIAEMQSVAESFRLEGKKIALVPTMGYLHQGHAALIRHARSNADIVVTSIFVNPTQFAPNEDYARYPRDLEHDTAVAGEAGTDIIFHPSAPEMFGDLHATYISVEGVSKILEGEIRPTHFRGVTTVVAKLFNIVKPHLAIFGQKDVQQVHIIQTMVRELNYDLQLSIVPIVREQDGLALSSRNTYLGSEERLHALVLSRSLDYAQKYFQDGKRNLQQLRAEMQTILLSGQPSQIDYIAFLHPETFQIVDNAPPHGILIALAVRFGSTRLIDNVKISF